MDGKKYFKQCCQEFGIDCDTYIKLGAGDPKDQTRYVYQCPKSSRKDSQIFAVKYFESDDIYIAWNLYDGISKGYNSFNLRKNLVGKISANRIYGINKPIVYRGNNRLEELVYVFRPKMVKQFLKVYILPNVKCVKLI